MEHKKLWLVYLFVWMLPKNEQENMHTTNNGSRTWTKDSMDHQNQHQHHHQSKGKEVGKVSARFLGKEIIWWDTIKTQRTVCSAPEEGRERHKSNKGGRGPSLLQCRHDPFSHLFSLRVSFLDSLETPSPLPTARRLSPTYGNTHGHGRHGRNCLSAAEVKLSYPRIHSSLLA